MSDIFGLLWIAHIKNYDIINFYAYLQLICINSRKLKMNIWGQSSRISYLVSVFDRFWENFAA